MKYLVIEQRMQAWPHTSHANRLEYEHEICDTREEAEAVVANLKARPHPVGYRSMFVVEEMG